jgi:hypothetical protein
MRHRALRVVVQPAHAISHLGYGASVRIGGAFPAVKHHALRISAEAFPAKFAHAFNLGGALNFEWQYY